MGEGHTWRRTVENCIRNFRIIQEGNSQNETSDGEQDEDGENQFDLEDEARNE